jgi:hypothetical protein
MSLIEQIYDDLNDSNDIYETSKKCDRTDRIILKVNEFTVTNPSLYSNMDLSIKLVVMQGGNEVDWIMMKKSSISGSGFGLFSLRRFRENDVISVYLGTKINVEEKLDYAFLDVNGRPQILEKNGLIQEYWLAHRINHGRYEQVNVAITGDYKISALRTINKGEELFLDYNRDILCSHCNEESCFKHNMLVIGVCSDCKKRELCSKHCSKCRRFICTECYYYSQIGQAIYN